MGCLKSFFADTTDISTIAGDSILNELKKIPCPNITKRMLKQVCEIDGKPVEKNSCNLVSIATCKTKIRNYDKKDPSVAGSIDKFLDDLR